MRRLVFIMLLFAFSTLAGCGLPDWQPKQPYLGGTQYSSDDYTQDKWSR